jgi:polyisoprenyl-phosphate glycosyltransferase
MTRPSLIPPPMPPPITLSIVLPVFNEAPNIPLLMERVQGLLDSLAAVEVEVIFVDDHSTDASPELLKTLCQQQSNYRYLRLSSNQGSHVAILAGLEYARGECAVFLASDLQDPPELIPEMLQLWEQGNQIIWAVRAGWQKASRLDRLCADLFCALLNQSTPVKVPPQGWDFALLDRLAINALLQSVGTVVSIDRDITRLGFRQAEVFYMKAPRHQGKSKWSFARKVEAAIDAFVLFSYMPLRVMTYLGFCCSALGFFYALFIIFVRLLTTAPVEGWASLIVVVLLMGGVQMIMIGVLGEYIWRILEESRRRPRFFLEDWYGLENPATTSPPQSSESSKEKYSRPTPRAGPDHEQQNGDP